MRHMSFQLHTIETDLDKKYRVVFTLKMYMDLFFENQIVYYLQNKI